MARSCSFRASVHTFMAVSLLRGSDRPTRPGEGIPFPIDHLSYEDAGHAIGAGYAPTTVNQSFHPIRKAFIDLGGTPEGLAEARADSWPRVLAFVAQQTGSATSESREVLHITS